MKELIMEGNCKEFTSDTYRFSKAKGNLFMELHDGDFDEHVDIVLPEEEAIELANAILKAFK